MDRRDDGVRRRHQVAVDLMRTRDRLGLGTAVAVKRRPDAGEAKQRPPIVQREPNDVLLLRLWVRLRRVLREAVRWHQATVLRLQPHAPVRR